MVNKLQVGSLIFLIVVALFSTILFFKTILSNLNPEFMEALAIPLALFSGLTLVALSISVREANK